MEYVFELNEVAKSFGEPRALQRSTLNIPSREITVLIGPSGCGKSTLLRLMLGLTQPDEGEIRFEGQPLKQDNVLSLRQRMGYVIQDGGLFPHLTASENVSLMARYIGWNESRISDRLEELSEFTRFPGEGFTRYPVQLSGGQRQRVSLMRALMLDPDVLLMDEPLGALDPMIRAGLQDDLRQIFKTLKKTVVMVTHDMGEAGFFGDSIVLMRDGLILQCGSLNELVKSPADSFVTEFINAQRTPLEGISED